MKLQMTKSGQFFLTLPREIVIGFNWQKGTELRHKITGEGKITLERAKDTQ